MTNSAPQLKKQAFLNAVTETPMTRAELVDSLEAYEFISSYLDFLVDHFQAQGKLIKNEDGTIQRKAKKGSASRDVYRVAMPDLDGSPFPEIEHRVMEPGETLDKENGWATTKARAVKNAVSAIHASYLEDSAAVKELLKEEAADTEEAA